MHRVPQTRDTGYSVSAGTRTHARTHAAAAVAAAAPSSSPPSSVPRPTPQPAAAITAPACAPTGGGGGGDGGGSGWVAAVFACARIEADRLSERAVVAVRPLVVDLVVDGP